MTARRTAADDERAARRAFREFARTHHPDRGEVVFVRRRGLRILTGWGRDRRAAPPGCTDRQDPPLVRSDHHEDNL